MLGLRTHGLVNEKVDTVVLCPYWPLTEIMKNSKYFKSKNGKECLRQGKEPVYHLLKETIMQIIRDFHLTALPLLKRRSLQVPLETGKIITLVGVRRSGKTLCSRECR